SSPLMSVKVTTGYATDIRVMHLAHEADWDLGETTNPDYIADVADASCIRFMDWMRTNDSEVVDYADYKDTSNNPRGSIWYIDLVDLCQIANDCDKDIWICLPTMGSDACYAEMAAVINANLNSHLKIRVEHGNELWNTSFVNNFYWMQLFDAPLYVSDSFDGTTGITIDAGHTGVTGATLRMMSFAGTNAQSPWDWKYGLGSEGRIIKDDANTFRIADPNAGVVSIGGITNATTAVV
ncbi:unnamed protein product, partial [marine sediment metagenome]